MGTRANPLDPEYPELLRVLAEVVARAVGEAGIDPVRAQAIGDSTAEQVSELLGGQVVYLPKATQYRTHLRWQRIWESFTGNNHAELAREFGMGMHSLYRVVAVMRAKHRQRAQPSLFGDGGPPEGAIASPEPQGDIEPKRSDE